MRFKILAKRYIYQAMLNKESDILIEKTRAVQIARDEALEEGREEGEKKAKIETAKNFLKMGLSVEQIAAGTGLSIGEVRDLTI